MSALYFLTEKYMQQSATGEPVRLIIIQLSLALNQFMSKSDFRAQNSHLRDRRMNIIIIIVTRLKTSPTHPNLSGSSDLHPVTSG